MSSLRLLSKFFLSLKLQIESFSDVHRLQDEVIFLNPDVLRRMDHFMLNFVFVSFRRQIYFESSVSFSYFLCLNDFLWLLSRSLKVGWLIPMYVFLLVGSLLSITSAL